MGGGVTLIATEGTIETKIYDNIFGAYDIKINSPGPSQYDELRYFIEVVKQNMITNEAALKFCDFVNNFKNEAIILGCTEIPILYQECLKLGLVFSKKIYDPLQSAINVLTSLFYS